MSPSQSIPTWSNHPRPYHPQNTLMFVVNSSVARLQLVHAEWASREVFCEPYQNAFHRHTCIDISPFGLDRTVPPQQQCPPHVVGTDSNMNFSQGGYGGGRRDHSTTILSFQREMLKCEEQQQHHHHCDVGCCCVAFVVWRSRSVFLRARSLATSGRV